MSCDVYVEAAHPFTTADFTDGSNRLFSLLKEI